MPRDFVYICWSSFQIFTLDSAILHTVSGAKGIRLVYNKQLKVALFTIHPLSYDYLKFSPSGIKLFRVF